MNFTYFQDYTALSSQAAQLARTMIQYKPDALFCIATGNSPKLCYEIMAQEHHFYEKLRLIQLDEWGGLPPTHPSSCAAYIQNHLIQPLQISSNTHFLFNGENPNLLGECQKAQDFLAKNGPIDLCILGLGVNGHLGFNEPSSAFSHHPFCVQLEETTQQHTMVAAFDKKPSRGITLSINDIMKADRIILLVVGENKSTALERLEIPLVSPDFPASCLWNHGQVEVLVLN